MSKMEDYKIVVAINKLLEPGVAMNATAHLTLGLVRAVEVGFPELVDTLQFLNYRTADGIDLPFVSARSLIVLRAKQGELRRLREDLRALGVPSTCFIDAMTGGTYVDQLARSSSTPFADVSIFGIACLAMRSEIEPLTRRLSLWR